jgi:hypothetical protein
MLRTLFIVGAEYFFSTRHLLIPVDLDMNSVGLILGLITAGAILGIFYYALRILETMRRGNLEQSWKYLSVGAMFAIAAMIAVIILDIPQNTPVASSNGLTFSDLPLSFAAAATTSFLLGFRSHYLVWHPKGMNEKEKTEAKAKTIASQ